MPSRSATPPFIYVKSVALLTPPPCYCTRYFSSKRYPFPKKRFRTFWCFATQLHRSNRTKFPTSPLNTLHHLEPLGKGIATSEGVSPAGNTILIEQGYIGLATLFLLCVVSGLASCTLLAIPSPLNSPSMKMLAAASLAVLVGLLLCNLYMPAFLTSFAPLGTWPLALATILPAFAPHTHPSRPAQAAFTKPHIRSKRPIALCTSLLAIAAATSLYSGTSLGL